MKLEQITIAVVNMEAMLAFYNGVFHCNLHPLEQQLGARKFYIGTLAGITLLFCPNEIPKIKADKNRQQFHFVVDNIEIMLELVQELGGQIVDPLMTTDMDKTAGIADPDGNTIVLAEPSE